jgi:hypothetical protein
MPVHKTIKHEAADRKAGMTLAEVAAFVQEAVREEIPGDTIVGMEATWKSSIKRLKIDDAPSAEERMVADANLDGRDALRRGERP